MTERSYGSKYDGNLTTKQIAEMVRRQVRLEARVGLLPEGKWSVTMDRFAGGSSIAIGFTPFPDDAILFARCFYNRERAVADVERPHDYPRLPWRSEFGTALEQRLERMLAAYNHDGSDTQTDYFDVKFYAHVNVHGPGLDDLGNLYREGKLPDVPLAELSPRYAAMLATWQFDEAGEPPAHTPEVVTPKAAPRLRLVPPPAPVKAAEPAPVEAAAPSRASARPAARAKAPIAVPAEQAPNPAWQRLALAHELALDWTIPGLAGLIGTEK